MVVLSPLLDLAGFTSLFEIETETSIEISAEDEGAIVKGSIDVLVIQSGFGYLLSKLKALSLMC